MTKRLTRIDLKNEYLKFSAAHFTIFSATERERLHGHNFKVSASFIAEVGDNGMCVDYAILKKRVRKICDSLDEYTLIANDSEFLTISEKDKYYSVIHHHDELLLLKSDTLLLPIKNTTVEEYSNWLLQELVLDKALMATCPISEISITVSSGPGQSGSSSHTFSK